MGFDAVTGEFTVSIAFTPQSGPGIETHVPLSKSYCLPPLSDHIPCGHSDAIKYFVPWSFWSNTNVNGLALI